MSLLCLSHKPPTPGVARLAFLIADRTPASRKPPHAFLAFLIADRTHALRKPPHALLAFLITDRTPASRKPPHALPAFWIADRTHALSPRHVPYLRPRARFRAGSGEPAGGPIPGFRRNFPLLPRRRSELRAAAVGCGRCCPGYPAKGHTMAVMGTRLTSESQPSCDGRRAVS